MTEPPGRFGPPTKPAEETHTSRVKPGIARKNPWRGKRLPCEEAIQIAATQAEAAFKVAAGKLRKEFGSRTGFVDLAINNALTFLCGPDFLAHAVNDPDTLSARVMEDYIALRPALSKFSEGFAMRLERCENTEAVIRALRTLNVQLWKPFATEEERNHPPATESYELRKFFANPNHGGSSALGGYSRILIMTYINAFGDALAAQHPPFKIAWDLTATGREQQVSQFCR